VPSSVPLLIPDLPPLDQLVPYLQRIDANHWYSNFGPLVQELESRLAQSFLPRDARPSIAVTVSNATAGIEMALRALNLPPAAPVLVPAMTFVATATAVLSAGLSPIVGDIDPDSWLLTPALALQAVRKRKLMAVVPVATFGVAQDAAGWDDFYKQTGLPVVIDAAAAYGNQVDPGPTCAVYSLHATKPLASGEGGVVVTRSPELARDIRQLSNFGINLTDPKASLIGTTTMIGTNAKLSEYHAAVGLASLDAWATNSTRRRDLYRAYTDAIKALDGPALSWQQSPADTVRSLCCFLLPTRELRDHYERQLAKAQIATRRWYLPTINRHPAFKHLTHFATPVADNIARRLLGVPFYPALSDDQRGAVLAALQVAATG